MGFFLLLCVLQLFVPVGEGGKGRGGGRVSTLYTLSCCFGGSFQYNFISFIYIYI